MPPNFNVIPPVRLEECVDNRQDCPKWIENCDPLSQHYHFMQKECAATCKRYNNNGGMDEGNTASAECWYKQTN